MPREATRARARGCWRARPRSDRAGSTRRRSRRPRASRRSPAPDRGDRCRARRPWRGSPGDRSGRRAGWWSRCRTGLRRSRRRAATSRVARLRSGTAGARTTPFRRGPGRAARPCPAEGRAGDHARGPWMTVPLGREIRWRPRRSCHAWAAQRLTQRIGNRPLGPVVGGDNDVDVVAAHRGLLVGVGVAPQHGEPQREAGRPDPLALRQQPAPHRASEPAPGNRSRCARPARRGRWRSNPGRSHRGGRGSRCTPRRTR